MRLQTAGRTSDKQEKGVLIHMLLSPRRVSSGGFVAGFAPTFSPGEKIFGSVESPAAEPCIDARTLAGGRDTQLLKIAPGYRVALGIEELDALDSRQTGHNGFISGLPFRLKHAIQKVRRATICS
jgi:hypothetical protein